MKRKTLTTALLAGLTGTVGIANISNAVNINPDGLGQVLIYPYYTVRDGNDTLVSVVNTTQDVKAVKVRFLEGENSREVLDFNLYLSQFDVWTAAIFENGTGASVVTADNSCTVPIGNLRTEGEPFRTFRFNDTGGTTADRTREGHLEIIEMGVVSDTANGAWATAATHGSDGVPASCATLNASWNGGVWDGSPSDGLSAPEGGLFGGASIINVAGGTDAAYNARAIDAFRETEAHSGPGDETPSLASANWNPDTGVGNPPVRSIVFDNGSVVTSDWLTPIDAVSAVFMHDQIMNEYVLDEATLSGTDWVVTFPTKRFYVDPAFGGGDRPPFTTTFPDDGVACEPVSLRFWDREEQTTTGEIDFSPLPPQGSNVLCYETNVVTFDNSDVLGSHLSENVNPGSFGFRLDAHRIRRRQQQLHVG